MYFESDFEQMHQNELETLLTNASDAYYNKSVPIMSDEEFDLGLSILKSKFPDSEIIKSIGSKVKTTKWEKAFHKIPMTSLNKVNTLSEFIEWSNIIGDSCYILMEKLDGISIDLEYDSGKLVKAITRGDGIYGENILPNVLKMKNVIRELDGFTGSLRGEIIIFVSDFEKLNEFLRFNNEKEMSNPRNAVNGISKRYDGKYSEYCSILFYDVTGDWDTEEKKLHWLEQNGLKTCFWVNCNTEQIITYYNEYERHLRSKTPYDIDGLVIKANSIFLQRKHGELNGNPKAHVAWKFTSMKAETTIEDVEWSHGQNMRITPIAILNPVRIGGVIVKKASLHNMEIFKNLNLGRGDKVLLSRRNDVIPYIESVIEHVGNIKFKPPIYCPMCNEELVEQDKFLICENTECRGLRLGNLNKWVQALDIDDISEKTIELFERAGIVVYPSDFYKLDINVISNLEGMGIKKATKIINNFKEKNRIDLATFIDGLNIPYFSRVRAEMLIDNGFDTLDKMMEAKSHDLVKIKGIGKEVADAIIYGLSKKKDVIKKLLEFVKIEENTSKVDISICSNKLSGEVVVFTGEINRVTETGVRYTRKMLQDLVVMHGGTCENSIKKNVTMLVQANSNLVSSKTKKAKELGISIISEDDFFRKIGM